MIQNVGRLQEIAAILIRYGFGDVVRRIGMAGVLERAGRALHWQAPDELARLGPPARVRRALEELGPTFVKLGQILATRMDLFEPAWIDEFSKLQDASPSLPFGELRKQLVADLRLLARLAEAVESRVPELRRYRLREVVRQFRQPSVPRLSAACRGAE